MTEQTPETPEDRDTVLLANWTKILRRAWSVRFMGLAAVLSAIEVGLALTDAQALGLSPGTFAAASAVATAAALVARLWAQRDLEE
ncbi:DUF7940 domain-containing protein [Paracoccus beibuensis]|uniref:DUF7940 domain-containing protein n=1 Tax=Paracoccus beibuensis TaxID=547602 RepID=UPI00223F08E1|nr:hypothetical protein [Paracoccus beibuensis]